MSEPDNLLLIPKYLPKRNDIPILNKIETIPNSSSLDFLLHIVAYYITDHQMKVIIRRMDHPSGWKENLIILLYDESLKNKEEINIGPSNTNYLSLNLTTNIELKKTNLDYEQIIPKRIVQTFETNKAFSILHYNTIMTLIELNPEYEYYFFDKDDRRKFIKDNFSPDILECYDLLVPGSYKADFFRFSYLYIFGGCYFDCKCTLRKPLREILLKNQHNFLLKDLGTPGLLTTFIASRNNQKFFQCIDKFKFFINNNLYDPKYICLSPMIFHDIFKDEKLDERYFTLPLSLPIWGISDQNKNIIVIFNYKGYHDECKKKIVLTHYTAFFNLRKMYCIKYGNFTPRYKIFFVPYKYLSETFDVKLKGNQENEDQILVVRKNAQKGWKSDLIIKIIDEKIDHEYLVRVGPSKEWKKEIKFR
jgi:hypothetical protein